MSSTSEINAVTTNASAVAVFDAHLDLASNALLLNRDLRLPLAEMNRREHGMNDHPCRANATVTLDEMRRGGVWLCSATLLARARPEVRPTGGFARFDIDYADSSIAHSMAIGQLAYYEFLQHHGLMQIIRTAAELRDFTRRHPAFAGRDSAAAGQAAPNGAVAAIGDPAPGDAVVPGGLAPGGDSAPGGERGTVPAIGAILSMEGAEPLPSAAWVPFWWERGLRFASLVHYGGGAYAGGTGAPGTGSRRTADGGTEELIGEVGLTVAGRDMLRAFDSVGMILDTTHLCDASFFEALDRFHGPVLASHNNCRRLVPGGRQFSDEQIRLMVQRNGVIGVACDAWMLYPDWQRGRTKPQVVGMAALADHIDHICDLAGDSDHVAIGSDLDGLFGTEQTPHDLRTIADLQRLTGILAARGYSETAINAIMHGNWLDFFDRALP